MPTTRGEEKPEMLVQEMPDQWQGSESSSFQSESTDVGSDETADLKASSESPSGERESIWTPRIVSRKEEKERMCRFLMLLQSISSSCSLFLFIVGGVLSEGARESFLLLPLDDDCFSYFYVCNMR